MDEFENYEEYSINLKKITEQHDFLAVTKLLAQSLMIEPYLTPGKWFKQLSDHDLNMLSGVIDEGDEGPHFQELLLIAEMLAQAEGVDERNLTAATERVNMLTILLTCVSLARKGMVKVNYQNMSFGADMKDKVVVEKI